MKKYAIVLVAAFLSFNAGGDTYSPAMSIKDKLKTIKKEKS